MSHFRLLRQPEAYRSSKVDLHGDEATRHKWMDLFARQFEGLLAAAGAQGGRGLHKRIAEAREEFLALLERVRQDPTATPSGRADLIELDHLREDLLVKHGLEDPYATVKAHENTVAADLYERVVGDTHELVGADRWLRTLRGVFAGNRCFDVGAASTMAADEPMGFYDALARVPARPWIQDSFDAFVERMLGGPGDLWTKAVLFVDNAGADFILGMLPLARELALAGTIVVLAANETPSLNDVPVEEVVEIIEHFAAVDRDLAALIEGNMFEVVSTGSRIPLLDLSDVTDELNEAAADADLIVLEGMARAVESNWDADFTVDCLRLAVLKDPDIAAELGAKEFDCLCALSAIERPPVEEGADDGLEGITIERPSVEGASNEGPDGATIEIPAD